MNARFAFSVLALIAASLLSPGAVWAQRGGEIMAIDAAVAGRAGVDAAIAEEISALVTNPAGLARGPSAWRVQLTAAAFRPDYAYEDALNEGLAYDDAQFAPSFGVSFDPDPDGPKRGDVRLAAGVYHLAAFSNDIRTVTADYPAPLGAERTTDFVDTALHAGIAWRMTEAVSLGLTLSLGYSTLEAREPFEISVFQFRGTSPLGNTWGELLNGQLGITDVRIDGSFESDPAFSLFATLGILIELSDVVSLGLTWRPPGVRETYEGDVDVDITRIFGEPDPVTFPDGFAVHYDGRLEDFELPQAATLGLAWRPDPAWRLALDLRWVGWSVSHDELVFRLENGDNPGFNAFVGSDRLILTERLLWEDQWAAAVAVEWAFAPGFIARAGFSAATNPVPDDATGPLAPGFLNYVLGLGIGYRGEGWAVDAAWMHGFEKTETVETSLVSSDLSGSRQTLSVDAILVTLTLTF